MPLSFSLEDVVYRPLSDQCPRGGFRCTEEDLNQWFYKDACKRHEAYTCRVVTAHLGDAAEPIGFYAMGIMLESDRLLKGTGPIRNRAMGGVYPVLHLEYLAVDERYVGNRLGPDMLSRALVTFTQSVIEIGVPVMTLVPLRDRLVKFYSDRGFVPYGQHRGEKRMMLTAAMAMKAYEAALN